MSRHPLMRTRHQETRGYSYTVPTVGYRGRHKALLVLTLGLLVGASFAATSHGQTLCSDGTLSSSSGSGTCSWHGGIAGGAPSDDSFYIPPASGGSVGLGTYTGRVFSSPSGNIQCRYEPRRRRLGCSSLSAGVTAWLSRAYYPWKTNRAISNRGPALPYGTSWSMGGFYCESATTGMVCVSPSADDYIALSKTGVFTSED